MSGSVYKMIELVGTSTVGWEDAAKLAIETASRSLSDLRVAEVVLLDMKVGEDRTILYRTKIRVSFKYHSGYEKLVLE
ncbi:MAG: dodecin family protein [Thermoleophilia bacterium]|nr:dodecin family protein [Thermoleophilia bacterium]